jgi:drug/metabolite transporter (DMT)-like permease
MLQLLAVSLLWAFSFGLVARVSPLGAALVASVRALLALALFLPFLRLKGLPVRKGLALGAVGALQFGLMYVFYTASFHWLHAGEVALLTLLTPLLVALAEDALALSVAWRALGVAVLAVAGTAVCLGARITQAPVLKGFLLVQAANACFALGQVAYRRVARGMGRPDHQVMGLLYGGAALVTLAAALPGLEFARLGQITGSQALVLAYLGLAASGLGFFLFNAGARRVSVGTLAVFNNAKVPLGVLVSGVVFGERLDLPRLLLGGGIIALALVLAPRKD